jgi:arginyl-tRNA synthetase
VLPQLQIEIDRAMGASDVKVGAPPKPELGDFAVPCFALAKERGRKPNEVAAEIAAAFQPSELLASATPAGPFVNFRANRTALLRHVVDRAIAGELVDARRGHGQTICIDYGSPNIAKHLAYHHIRGTTLGHALAQIFRTLGYRVVGINHLGDWGTNYGMIIEAWKRWGPIEPLTIDVLDELYRRIRAEPNHDVAGRAWFKKIESGDPEARALWQRFREVSWAEFATIYDLLGIEYDEIRGESAYEDDIPRVIADLDARGFLVESEGARVVQLDGEKTPILILTKDGTSLYATRDVATAEYRWSTYQFARSLYVVAREQALHFRQLFKLLAKMGYDWASRCEHVPYGLIQVGGKKGSSRLGNVTLMKDVFAIATDEVRAKAREPLDDTTARAVGIGAIVFANLAVQRDKDIDFDLDKATSLDGDSGPYLQYSHARCASIQRKAGETVAAASEGFAPNDLEWAVARRIIDFADHVERAAQNCEPHVIAHYLLELAADFSRWYTAGNGDASLRVLCDDLVLRRARLALVGAVQATLARGLALLGIAAPDRM